MFLQRYEFVAAIHMMCDILPVLAALFRCFQTRDGMISAVGSLVAGTISTIKALKEKPGQHFQNVPAAMDSLKNQPFRFKSPTDRQIEDFHNNVYQKFLDSVVENLERRFPDTKEVDAFRVFSSQEWPEDQAECSVYGQMEIELLADKFRDTLLTPHDTAVEFQLVKNTIRLNPDLRQQSSTKVMEKVAGTLAVSCPNLAKIAAVGLLIPASTADCERGFSTLKRVKRRSRNSLTNNNLQALLMISMEGPPTKEFLYEKAVEKRADKKQRRLEV